MGTILDDELKSRESLTISIEDFRDRVDVVALCQNVDEVIEAQRLLSDVAFSAFNFNEKRISTC
jgi:hypothetical protein